MKSKNKIEIRCKSCGKLHIKLSKPKERINFEWDCARCKERNVVTIVEKNSLKC